MAIRFGVRWLILLLLPIFVCGCFHAPGETKRRAPERKRLKIGFSQPEINNPWRIAESLSMQQAARQCGARLIVRDAKSDVETQKKDVSDFIQMKVDYIVLAPRVEEGFAAIFQAARQAKIPIILVDRKAKGTARVDFATSITADFQEEGRKAARVLADRFKGKRCNIVEISGTPGATSTVGRSVGFREVIDKYPKMRIVDSESGEYVRTVAQHTMALIIQSGKYRIDAVFAHDDDSGIGAIQAFNEASLIPGKDIIIVSVAGEHDALKAIIAGELEASIQCNPRLGGLVFEVIAKLEKGRPVPKEIVYSGKVYDASNAERLFGEAF